MVTDNQIFLCIGDNSSKDAWGHKLSEKYALENRITFRGEITNIKQVLEPGCYHTGTYRLEIYDLINLAKKVDRIILLDQSQEQYSHPDIFGSTFKFLHHLIKLGIEIKVLNPENFEIISYWTNLFKKNKSFCIFPWIYHGGYDGHHTTCYLDYTPQTKINEITDWQKDKNFVKIRQKMLNGEKREGCKTCYNVEQEYGFNSARIQESIKWATELKLKSTDDLKKITKPVYYEVRPTTKCNVMCRTCEPNYSHLIEKEREQITDQKLLTLYPKKSWYGMTDFPKDIDHIRRIYVAGGEPTVQPSLYDFLRKCIKENKTDFHFRINTNAVKISNPLIDLFGHFKGLGFSCSIDGIPKINDYIRWGTNTSKVIENIHRLGIKHPISFVSVISIYNIDTLGETMKFFDTEFPRADIQLNLANFSRVSRKKSASKVLDPFNHPNTEKVIRSLELAKTSKCYWHSERTTTTFVDALYDHYTKPHLINKNVLKDFFYYNDALDRFRNSKLSDYIPELESCRSLVQHDMTINNTV
jgi:MoaA/NifB/PqqE/SkfB family radical SAM enzyme